MRTDKDFLKALRIAKKYGIKIKFTKEKKVVENGKTKKGYESKGNWERGKIITINPRRATAYTVLHEIGHSIAGYMCCREHCEYTAHGVAIGLAKAHNIKLNKDKNDIFVYAGRTSHKGGCTDIIINKTIELYEKGKTVKQISEKNYMTQKATKEMIRLLKEDGYLRKPKEPIRERENVMFRS